MQAVIMAGGVLTNEAICPKGLLIYESTAEGSLSYAELIADLTSKGIKFDASLIQSLNPLATFQYNQGAAYGVDFYNIMVPFVVIISAIYTAG